MGLLEEFQATEKRSAGPLCTFALLNGSLDPKTVIELNQLLATDAEHTALARFITAKWPEYKVRAATVSRHRRGECSCGSL